MKRGAAKLRWVGRALHSFEFLVNKPRKTGVCSIRARTVGGFNVSNLMGIKRRMIDVGKKKTFFFLQNV
jgi:hypothetical protein